jgi:demethylmenaquinone methyltransferase/2-methoxy-6-polyprenyl-1,4-benzoquinol methylase
MNTAETRALIKKAAEFDPLIKPIVGEAIQALKLPSGSQGLDAGCGIGLQALLLAEAVGSDGQIIGLDISPDLLSHAKELVDRHGMSKRISYQQGDIRKLPFHDDKFDWAWSANCVGYAPLDPLPLVKELVRVVKPGGVVAIFAWSSENLLPGYPVLEARLKGSSSGVAPFAKGKNPRLHFLRALGWFHDAGMEEISARAFVGCAHAPLADDLRTALISLFQMRWPGVESELAPEELTEYRRLCLPESPEFILNDPDYYAFFTYTMFQGKIPQ